MALSLIVCVCVCVYVINGNRGLPRETTHPACPHPLIPPLSLSSLLSSVTIPLLIATLSFLLAVFSLNCWTQHFILFLCYLWSFYLKWVSNELISLCKWIIIIFVQCADFIRRADLEDVRLPACSCDFRPIPSARGDTILFMLIDGQVGCLIM